MCDKVYECEKRGILSLTRSEHVFSKTKHRHTHTHTHTHTHIYIHISHLRLVVAEHAGDGFVCQRVQVRGKARFVGDVAVFSRDLLRVDRYGLEGIDGDDDIANIRLGDGGEREEGENEGEQKEERRRKNKRERSMKNKQTLPLFLSLSLSLSLFLLKNKRVENLNKEGIVL